MIDSATIDKAARLLLEAAPGSRVILFGSYARGDATEESDLDFLVIEPEVKSRGKEMVRLLQVLHPLEIPVDVRVIGQKAFEEWRDTPNTLYYDAATEGRIFDAAA